MTEEQLRRAIRGLKRQISTLRNTKVNHSEFEFMRRQIKTFRKRWAKYQKRTLNKYYHWQYYFEKKKERYQATYKAKVHFTDEVKKFNQLLKSLHLRGLSYKEKKIREKRFLLLMTHNDIERLRRFLSVRHYRGREFWPGYGLVYLPKKERYRLSLFLNDARWKRLNQLLKMRKIKHLRKKAIELIFEPEEI